MKNLFKLTKNKKGFTLVELMVVVAIIGVLTLIAVPVYNNVTENARKKADLATIKSIQTAISLHLAANPTDDSVSTAEALVYLDYAEWPTPQDTTAGEAFIIENNIAKQGASGG